MKWSIPSPRCCFTGCDGVGETLCCFTGCDDVRSRVDAGGIVSRRATRDRVGSTGLHDAMLPLLRRGPARAAGVPRIEQPLRRVRLLLAERRSAGRALQRAAGVMNYPRRSHGATPNNHKTSPLNTPVITPSAGRTRSLRPSAGHAGTRRGRVNQSTAAAASSSVGTRRGRAR